MVIVQNKEVTEQSCFKVKAILRCYIYAQALYNFIASGVYNNMHYMLDFICIGSIEPRGTGSKQKVQNEK